MKRNSRKNKNTRRRNLTISELRKLVLKEASELSGELESVEKVKAEEVEASEFADTLEKDLDMYKAMKIKEAKLLKQHRKLVKEARKVRRNKQIAKKRILRTLK
mgnify:FL=1|tara:strand:- start:305 stop:616 length:312 start_codon:yes stop_codon:yes gene_type:complete